jgi:hypothetical protein
MGPKSLEAAILTGILGLWLPAAASAQTKAQAPSPAASKTQTKQDSKAPSKLPLKDLGVISTAEAAREAAKAKAQGPATSQSGPADVNGVLEFQAVKSESSSDSPSKDARLKDHKKPLLKDFHGSVYGAAAGQGSGGRTAAGEAGASSKSGKLNVYVEGEHSQANSPGSH